jgi:hypothetical protein
VAVNGTIRAVTRSYADRGAKRFAALVPESSLRQGANDIRIYAVVRTSSGLVLEELDSDDLVYTLADEGDALESSDGTTIAVTPDALSGEVRAMWTDGDGWFDGWAADLHARKPAGRIVVMVGDRSVYVTRPGQSRKAIRDRYHVLRTGFIFRIPGELLPKPGDGEDVHVYAVRGGSASELEFETPLR